MNARLREAQLACMILTRLPAGHMEGGAPPISQSSWAFPLVGAIVGVLMAAAFSLAGWLNLPPLAAALLAISVAVLATGALHEDGLADTADGFGGGTKVTRKLEIMKDSRIGSYGVLSLILTLGLTASAIAASGGFWMFVAIAAASRAAMLVPMILLAPARAEGLGRSADMQVDSRAVAAGLLALLLMLLAGTLAVPLVMVLTAVAVTALAKRQIGGQTGDVLGATQKLSECAGWLTAAAISA